MSVTPYPIRIDRDHERRWNRYSLWAALTTLAGLVATIIELFQSGQFGLAGWIGFSSFALGIYLMNRKHRSMLKNYACPNCLASLETPKHRKLTPHETAITFDCERCQITWDTAMRESDE
jgi:predicted RNA-binding Zn-ribbon protein involved in translation (DUF1610 family)